ncbi:MAG: diguanylate cyclase [Butyrivibrio sp.]|nr:diguanylate cyclase [Butyrivibrio sp.]
MSKRVLIVDDDVIVRRIAANTLSKKYDIVSASSGNEALDLYDEHKPDLVLMDINMPDMTGYEVFNVLLNRNDPIPPTVVFMTSEDDVQSEIKGFDMGAADYIHKPFHPDILLRRVDVVLNNIEKYEFLEKGAETDKLTGIFNRETVELKVKDLLLKKEYGTFLMIDIDNFKTINDNFGHATGDQIIACIADALKKCARSTDIVGRVGGDEFVIYYNSLTDKEQVAKKCEIIQEKIVTVLNTILPSTVRYHVGVSIGACRSPNDGADYETLYKNADKAMYQAKRNGKGDYVFYEGEKNSIDLDEIAAKFIDIPMTMQIIGERGHEAGAYSVNYNEFCNIYRFLKRHAERNDDKVQFVIFTLKPKKNAKKGNDRKGAVITEFSKAVEKSLRRSDVAARVGDRQVMMLLTGTDSDHGMIAINRIVSRWISDYYSDEYDAVYELQDICG